MYFLCCCQRGEGLREKEYSPLLSHPVLTKERERGCAIFLYRAFVTLTKGLLRTFARKQKLAEVLWQLSGVISTVIINNRGVIILLLMCEKGFLLPKKVREYVLVKTYHLNIFSIYRICCVPCKFFHKINSIKSVKTYLTIHCN